MATALRIASDVTISPLRGYTYPASHRENEIFCAYFQDAREISKGGFIYLSNLSVCNVQECYIDFEIFPYKVIAIQAFDDNSHSCSSTDSAITSRQRTKVVLEGTVVDTSQYALHIYSYLSNEVSSPTSVFSSLSSLTYLNVRYSHLSEQFHQFDINIVEENWREKLSNGLSRYIDKANRLTSFDSMKEQEVDFLRQILPRIKSSINTPVQSILVDCSKSSEQTVVEESLFNVSQKLGLRFITTESRLLGISRQKSSSLPLHGQASDDSTPLKPLQYWSPLSVDVLQQLTGAKGILLYITYWDLIVEQSPAPVDHSGSSSNSKNDSQSNIHQESLVDVTCQSLLDFQQELIVHAQTPANKGHSQNYHPMVIMVAITMSSTTWLPHWKNHHSLCRKVFPILWTPPSLVHEKHIFLTTTAELEEIPATDNIQFSTDALQLLSQILIDLQDGHLVDDSFCQHNTIFTLKSSPMASLAIQEALTRMYGWEALMDMLPTMEDTSSTNCSSRRSQAMPPCERLMYRSAVKIVSEEETLVVLLEDVQRAFHMQFPHKPLPQIPNNIASSSMSTVENDHIDSQVTNNDNNSNSIILHKSNPVKMQKKQQKKKKTNQYIEPVYWEDIGGLDRVRNEILDVLELPFHHPELFPPHAPRRQGVLLYGPPGTGKTLVAKAVATECNMAFLSVKGPELLDAYVGESEKNVRELFAKARRLAPCVLFFDEIDSLAPARAKRNDSGGGVTDRIVSQLLTELDLLVSTNNNTTNSASNNNDNNSSNNGSVFVIAATNRPDLLDPALLRPGRFDRKIYLGVCSDLTARQAILTAQTRKFQLASNVDFAVIAAHCLPKYVTGADLGAVSSSAYSLALERKLQELENLRMKQMHDQHDVLSSEIDEHHLDFLDAFTDDMLRVVVTQEDFETAARHLVPSVVDLSYYEELHAKYDSSVAHS